MQVAGIDCSTVAIDVVLLELDDDSAQWLHFDLGKKSVLIDRLARIGDILGRTWDGWDDVLAVGIERPMKRGHGSAHSAMAFGAVLTRIPADKLKQEWTPSGWRSACGLRGKASKDEVAAWANNRRYWGSVREPTTSLIDVHVPVPVPVWPQDACDAYCIAYATRGAIEPAPQDDIRSPNP